MIKFTKEEIQGHDTSCTCETCIATSEVALQTGDLDRIDGFRRGYERYHEQHNVKIATYMRACGYEMSSEFAHAYKEGLAASADPAPIQEGVSP